MRNFKLVIACVCFFELASAQAETIVVNGSFESPTVPVGTYTNFLGGTDIGGWTIVGVDSAIVNTNAAQNGVVFNAQDGQQWIDLAGINSNSQTSGVTQNISTIPGMVYELSFHVGSAFDDQYFFPSTIDLSIDGGARTSFHNSATPRYNLNWQLFTSSFTAQSSLTSITFYNGGASSNYLSALDNISIREIPSAVPLPSALALLLSGLPGGIVLLIVWRGSESCETAGGTDAAVSFWV